MSASPLTRPSPEQIRIDGVAILKVLNHSRGLRRAHIQAALAEDNYTISLMRLYAALEKLERDGKAFQGRGWWRLR